MGRLLLGVFGLVLLGLAGLVNYDTQLLYSDAGRVFVQVPGARAGELASFPVWWVIAGLAVVLPGVGLFSQGFRRALVAPFRSARTAIPLVAVLLFLGFSLYPWEFSWVRPSRSHIVPFLILGTGGTVLLLSGAQRLLAGPGRLVQTAFGWLLRLSPVRFALLTAGFTFVAANLMSWFTFRHVPHLADSIAQLSQARIFASGRLYLDSPPFPDFFDHDLVVNNGRWYSQFPPFHSLLLALGVLVRMPWVVNPILGALFVLALHRLGRELYDEVMARSAALLACLSPFVLAMSSEYMNHASALLCVTLFMLGFFQTLRTHGWAPALLAGVSLGCAAAIRPYTAIAVAAPFVVYGVYQMFRTPRLVGRFSAMALVSALIVGLMLLYNQLTNGNPFLFGYVVRYGTGHEIGFGHSGWGLAHTPLRGLVNTGHDLNKLNKCLFEWPIPSLAVVLLVFLRGRFDRRDGLLLAGFLSLVVAYFFYWSHGIAFGARFEYEAAACLLLLGARGLESLGESLRRTFDTDIGEPVVRNLLGRAAIIVLAVFLLFGLVPFLRSYRNYWGITGLANRPELKRLKNAIVFCPNLGQAFNANSLDLSGEVVYAQDLGVLNPALTTSFPGRNCYLARQNDVVPLPDLGFADSRLKLTLDSLAACLLQVPDIPQAQLVWPFKDLSPARWSGPVTDYRAISNEVQARRRKLRDYLPAVAAWVKGDPRDVLPEFKYMEQKAWYVAGDCEFRRLRLLADSSGALFLITPTKR
jgi:hypothetical protein